jgi:hypothetical protein
VLRQYLGTDPSSSGASVIVRNASMDLRLVHAYENQPHVVPALSPNEAVSLAEEAEAKRVVQHSVLLVPSRFSHAVAGLLRRFLPGIGRQSVTRRQVPLGEEVVERDAYSPSCLQRPRERGLARERWTAEQRENQSPPGMLVNLCDPNGN